MKSNNRVKLLSLFTKICLFWGVAEAYAGNVSPSLFADLAKGATEWSNNCTRCHNFIPATEYSAENWQVILLHMRIQAGLTGQEARDIYAFLAAQSSKTPTTTSPQTNNQAVTTTPVTNNPPNNATASTVTIANNTQKQNATQSSPSANTTTTTENNTDKQNTTPSTPSLSGSTIYSQACVACHGANGKGAVPGAPDFTNANGPLTKSDAVLQSHIENGFQDPGAPMAMPPKGGNSSLTNSEIKDVLAYIRKTFRQNKQVTTLNGI